MKRIFLLLTGLSLAAVLHAQVGEVTSEEIVIEKDKEIVLPKADKLYAPVITPDLIRDSVRLRFTLANPQFNIGPYLPTISPFAYRAPSAKLPYQNFVKAGLGTYGSPLLTAYVGQELPNLTWGAWAYHESFARGAVRERESGSSTTMLDVFGTMQNNRWAFTPAIGWQSDGYRYFGYADGDPRITTDRTTLGRVRLAATVEEIYANEWTLKFNPTLYLTNQNIPGDLPSSKESYFDLSTQAGYQFDSTFSAGTFVQMGAIGFNSPEKVNRNFMRINPWVGFKKDKLYIKAGFEVATTNDTIVSGASSFFYPDVSAEWSGLPGWTVYAGLKGELRPVTFSSMSLQNYFLDDTLNMAHENVKTSFTGGIRGAITSKLFLNAGIRLSGVQNMSFFVPSAFDSARFAVEIDTKTVTVFNLYGGLNWQPADNTHVGFAVDIYSYGMGNLDEPWHKPTFKMSADWFQRFSDRITTETRFTTLGGIKAPTFGPLPDTFLEQSLDPIIDLSVQGNYQINERIEGFIQLQNVFSQQYERFLNYPNRGFQVRIGGMYRF
jgi:hypothetical protein